LEKIPSFLNLTWTRKTEDAKLGDTSKNETSLAKTGNAYLKQNALRFLKSQIQL
jgi:hypothetical protein